MSLSTYPEIKFSRVKYTASPSTIKASRETTLRLITVQHRKKPSLTPDLEGQRASCNKTGKKETFLTIADKVQTLWAAQEDPSNLISLIKTQPKLSSSLCHQRRGGGSKNKCGYDTKRFHVRGFLLWFYLHHQALVLSQRITGSSWYPQASHSFQEQTAQFIHPHSPFTSLL